MNRRKVTVCFGAESTGYGIDFLTVLVSRASLLCERSTQAQDVAASLIKRTVNLAVKVLVRPRRQR